MSSYSFGFGRGSESGVGWNIASGMAARGHQVTVVTTSEFHALNFSDDCVRDFRILEYDFDIKDFNSSAAYNKWQSLITGEIQKLCLCEHFDLIHHVTFNQYRCLKDVFGAEGIPYVIGPIGGAETVAPIFWRELPFKQAVKEVLRYIPFDVLPLKKRIQSHGARGVVLASTPQTAERLKKWAGLDDVLLTPIISVHESEILSEVDSKEEPRYIVFDGGTRPEKGLNRLLESLAVMWRSGISVPIKVAAVPLNDVERLKKRIAALGLPENAVQLMPFMKRAEWLSVMRKASAFVSIGFRDAGCMSLLEAVALGIPSLCLDITGQFWLPEDYALKIAVRGRHFTERLAEGLKILLLHSQKDENWHVKRSKWLRDNMTWSVRLDYIESAYHRALQLNLI